MGKKEITQRIWISVWVLISSFFILVLVDSIQSSGYTIIKSIGILIHSINLILQLHKISYLNRKD